MKWRMEKYPIRILDENDHIICEGIYPSQIEEANLIVTAPELLEACKNMTALCEQVYGRFNKSINEQIDHAKLTIQKATQKDNLND